MKPTLIIISVCFLVFLMAGCNSVTPSDTAESSSTPPPMAAVEAVDPTPSPTLEDTPVNFPDMTPTPNLMAAVTPIPVSGNGSDLLRFVFPTPAPKPISAWRPPLYEAPWAPTRFDHFFFTRPISADEINWPLPNYRYGAPWPDLPDVIHTGIDIEAPEGAPIYAAAPGKVIWTGYGLQGLQENQNDPYGMAVLIQHDFGYEGRRLQTVYAHMSEISVIYGQWVDTSTQLGLVGNTGFTTGPHLHFEVRLSENGWYTTRNPELWLAPPEGWGVMVGQIMGNDALPIPLHPITVVSLEADQKWNMLTYGGSPSIKADRYYYENFVLSDLPAGKYLVEIPYGDKLIEKEIEIFPGRVSYFSMQGDRKFDINPSPKIPASFWESVLSNGTGDVETNTP
ncbi:MAG TPA: peptidoglycan DD-metalloendopeptidase family protein [Anaerolineaceae bacterium]|nr:peptidoglycan DD-metalloendopeptidase family protein [Anaerolineaceae bacterium]